MLKLFSNLNSINSIRSITNKGFFHLFSANILIYFISFGSQFVVAWILSPEQLGQIKIMQTYLTVSLLFTTFGFNTSVLKLCSESRSKGQILFIYKKALKYITITLCIGLPLLLILTKANLISNDEVVNKYFIYFLIALIPSTFISIYTSYFQAIKQIKLFSKINIATKAISVVIIILLTWLFHLNGYIIALLIGYFVTFIILKTNISKNNKKIQIEPIDNPFRLHKKYAVIAFITNLVGQLSLYADVFLMNYLVADKLSIGYYSFALTLTLVMIIYRSTVQQIAVPFLSEKSADIVELKNKSRKYDIINIGMSSLLVAILYFLIPILVTFFFGTKYDASIPYFNVLIIAILFSNISAFKGYTLWSIGEIKYNLYTSVIILIVNYIISFYLVKKMGIMGLAYGKLFTNFVAVFIVYIFFKYAMKIYEKKSI